VLITLLFVVAWPIAKLLDMVLGKEHGTFFRRAELKELVHLHAEDGGGGNSQTGEPLTDDEVRIIRGAIDLKEKIISEVMTPINEVYAISIDDVLDKELLQKIVDSGHDRVPVYHLTRDHFVGIISVKNLIMLDPHAQSLVRDVKLYRVPLVPGDMPLYELLHQFQSGRSHMAIVLDPANHINPIGIITLEDLIEELLQAEILDEDDLRRQKHTESKTALIEEIAKDKRLQGYLHRPSLFPDQTMRRHSMAPSTFRRNTTFVPAQNVNPYAIAPANLISLNDDGITETTPILKKPAP